MASLTFKDNPPYYVSNQQVHQLLATKICDMSRIMSATLMRSSEHGEFFLEGKLSPRTRVRTISYPLSMTVVEISDKNKTLAFDRNNFLIIDDEALVAMETAALVLCVFKASMGHGGTFVVGDDYCSCYLAQALLEEDLCERVLVASEEACGYLDDDRVGIGSEGTLRFERVLQEVPKGLEFLATQRVKATKNNLAEFAFRVCVEGQGETGFLAISDLLREGLPGGGSVLFHCPSSMVCKTVVIKMLLDALEGKNAV